MAEPYEPRHMTMLSEERDADLARIRGEQDVDPEAEAQERADYERRRKIVERGLDCFRTSQTEESEQRQREIDDFTFERGLPEDQWPDSIRKDRAAHIAPDGSSVAEKPCLTINRIDVPIQQVLNEARQARLGIQIKVKGRGAKREDAELRQGLIRSIEVDSQAHLARMWALDRAVKGGRGYYRILVDKQDDGDDMQDLVVAAIENVHSVYYDPFTMWPDWRDATWCHITTDLPEHNYSSRFSDVHLPNASGEALQGLGDNAKEWVTGEPGKRTIRVSEYFYVTFEEETLVDVAGIGPKWLTDLEKMGRLDELMQKGLIRNGRQAQRRVVHWCLMDAYDILKNKAGELQETTWPFPEIPVIPVLGKKYYVNGKRCFKGMVGPAKDAQRGYNYTVSAEVSAVALAQTGPWIMAEGQDEGYEIMWDEAHTRLYNRLKYKPISFDDGSPVPPPRRVVEEPAIQAMMLLGREFADNIKAVTGRFDPSLGRQSPERSGRAIRELKIQGETGTSNYLQSLAELSITREGRILNGMLEHVYIEPGRIARILGDDDAEKSVMLNTPFAMNAEGMPQQVQQVPQAPPGGQPPGMMNRAVAFGQRLMGRGSGQAMGMGGASGGPPAPPDPSKVKTYDLLKGSFSVVVGVGQSKQTEKEEDREVLQGLMQVAPGLGPVLADLLVGTLEGPTARVAAERLRKMNPQAGADDDQPPVPPKVAQELEAVKQQHQQLVEALKIADQNEKTDKIKAEMQAQIKQMEIASKERIAAMQARTDVLLKMAEIKGDLMLKKLEATLAVLQQTIDKDADVDSQRREHANALEVIEATPVPSGNGHE